MKFNDILINLLVLIAPLAQAQDAGEGELCKVKYMVTGSGFEKYQSATGQDRIDCADGLLCYPDPEEEAIATKGSVLSGTCNTTVCAGQKDPEDLSEGDLDDSNEASIRVTICHRTCSEHNPWVRITIDDDAWNGTHASGCGHSLQHDVRDECSKYAYNNWEAWGANKKDYLIKWHGTREYVRQTNGWPTRAECASYKGQDKSDNKAVCEAEKDYWRIWERACPYVRNGHCCSWKEGNCCGDDPDLIPSITLEKTAGPPGTCGVDMSQQVEVHVGTAGEDFEYCYKVTNDGAVCLEDLTMTDPLLFTPIAVGTPFTQLGSFPITFTLCPNENAYVTLLGPIPDKPEGPLDATVEGKQQGTSRIVEASDHASVVPAAINVEKTAGPPGTCGNEALMSSQVEVHGDALGADFEWCYAITNPSGTCLKDIEMSDSSVGFSGVVISIPSTNLGDMEILANPAFADLLCPGDVVYLTVPKTIPSGGNSGDGVVTATPNVEYSPPVTDQDDASVVPVSISLEKTAGPLGTCGVDMSQQVETYKADADSAFEYCYAITVPVAGVCVNAILMSDLEISNGFENVEIIGGAAGVSGGPSGFSDQLCFGDAPVYYTFESTIPGPNGEAKEATVSGVGVVPEGTGPTVTDVDPAGVEPPAATPSVILIKTAGPKGTCGMPMDPPVQVELYTAKEGEIFEYCYEVINPGTICLKNFMMTDPSDTVQLSVSGLGSTQTDPTTGLISGFVSGPAGFVDELCGGEKVFFKAEGLMPPAKEGPIMATVTADSSEDATASVTSSDDAAVEPTPPTPEIFLEKTAGPPGSCGGSMEGQSDTYTAPIGEEFEYCYKMFVGEDGVCINQILMSDTDIADGFSGTIIDSGNENVVSAPEGFVDTLCAGEEIYFKYPSTVPGPNGEGPLDGKVDGKGPNGGAVSATDPASVAVPVVIELAKTSGPRGSCGVNMTKQVEEYVDVLFGEFEYCYAITNPGGVCLKNILMSDTLIKDSFTKVPITNLPGDMALIIPAGLNFVSTLCAEETVYVSKQSTIPGPDGESFDAIVDATSDTPEAKEVTAQDHSAVKPTEEEEIVAPTATPQVDPTPTGSPQPPNCDQEMPGKGSAHCGTYNGVQVISVVGPEATSFDADILYSISAAGDGKSVSFKVTSPFAGSVDMYTQYHKPSGTGGGWFEACDGEMAVPECGPNASLITADCIEAEGNPFSVIQVFFVSSDAGFLGGAAVDECCHIGAAPPVGAVAQYTFLVSCTCPQEAR